MGVSKTVSKLYFAALAMLEAIDDAPKYAEEMELTDGLADAHDKLRLAVENYQEEELSNDHGSDN